MPQIFLSSCLLSMNSKVKVCKTMKGIQNVRAVCMSNPGNLSYHNCRHHAYYTLYKVWACHGVALNIQWSLCKHNGSTSRLHNCWAMCCCTIFVVRGGKLIRDSQKNVGTIQRKLYYLKEMKHGCTTMNLQANIKA